MQPVPPSATPTHANTTITLKFTFHMRPPSLEIRKAWRGALVRIVKQFMERNFSCDVDVEEVLEQDR